MQDYQQGAAHKLVAEPAAARYIKDRLKAGHDTWTSPIPHTLKTYYDSEQ